VAARRKVRNRAPRRPGSRGGPGLPVTGRRPRLREAVQPCITRANPGPEAPSFGCVVPAAGPRTTGRRPSRAWSC